MFTLRHEGPADAQVTRSHRQQLDRRRQVSSKERRDPLNGAVWSQPTDSCWPATWKSSDPNRSIGGSSSSPSARIEVRAELDEPSDDRVRSAQVFLGEAKLLTPSFGVGLWGWLAGPICTVGRPHLGCRHVGPSFTATDEAMRLPRLPGGGGGQERHDQMRMDHES